ncbi:MAG TPA: ABC transporter substrate-binding protein [Vineibacter sp.]|nr:ABC transporter substrate-binding protein [Vineibacter sp.]
MSTTLTRRAGITAMGAAFLSVAVAPAMASDAADVVKNGANRMLQVLKSGASDAERRATLTELMNQSFDLQTFGRTVLGRHWNAATPEQRQRFLTAFQRSEVNTYADRFKQYSGQTLQVGKVSTNGKAQLVESQIVQPNDPPIRIVWEVQNGRITDVTVEGVSMAVTRRADFNAYIQKNGIDGLIAELERRAGS